jgi:hypothetical protein
MKVRTLLNFPALFVTVPFACAQVGSITDESDAGGAAGSGEHTHAGGEGSGGHGGEDHGAAGGLGGATGETDLCCVLGAICHVVGGADDPKVDECHEIGHENDAEQCAAHFDRCHKLCEGLTDEPEPHACQ